MTQRTFSLEEYADAVRGSHLIIPDQTGIDDGWSPFDADGNLRDLEAEGWHRMGALKDGAS